MNDILRTGDRQLSPIAPVQLGGIPSSIYHGPSESDPATKAALDDLAAFVAQRSVELENKGGNE